MTEHKIVDLPKLQKAVADLRATGKKMVFANGCFDVLHAGHIRYLEAAKRLGDVLVVAVNSDASVQRIKEPGRPLLSEAARSRLVAALRCVDYVILFDEPTVERLLQALEPEIHAKGTDYTEESVPEREAVRSYGGAVRIAGDSKDHSTRGLIRQILVKSGSHH
ncbi:MAG: adenylyltransferase/cytidyltransferase family protein [Acidobacteriia bacterium]|nr:adenylyltransferase/cytidyltransferase family protein [Terriglobia bacterium]